MTLMHAFTGENSPWASSISVSLMFSGLLLRICVSVTLSLLSFTKMMLLSALKVRRQLYFLTYPSES